MRRNNTEPSTYLTFNGATSCHVDLGVTDIVPNGTGAFSCTVWVYLTGYGAGSTDRIATIVGNRRDSTTKGWLFKMSGNPIGKLEFAFWNPAGGNRSWISEPSVPRERWAHVGIVFTGTQTTFYIDGVPNARQTISSTTISENTADNVLIGWRAAAGGAFEHFKGHMARLALYNRALTTEEVANTYNGSPPSTGRVGYWEMNDGSGTTVTGDYDGTIVGGVTWATDPLNGTRHTGSRTLAASRTLAGTRTSST